MTDSIKIKHASTSVAIINILFIGILFCLSTPTHAGDVPFEFDDQKLEQRYKDLIEEIRCLVCQNQSLADSNADLAQDLRQEVQRMILDGQSNAEIIDFLTSRYGDFVLYRPPLKTTTYLLWFGPFLLLLLAILITINIARKRDNTEAIPLSNEEKRQLDELLNQDPDGDQE